MRACSLKAQPPDDPSARKRLAGLIYIYTPFRLARPHIPTPFAETQMEVRANEIKRKQQEAEAKDPKAWSIGQIVEGIGSVGDEQLTALAVLQRLRQLCRVEENRSAAAEAGMHAAVSTVMTRANERYVARAAKEAEKEAAATRERAEAGIASEPAVEGAEQRKTTVPKAKKWEGSYALVAEVGCACLRTLLTSGALAGQESRIWQVMFTK